MKKEHLAYAYAAGIFGVGTFLYLVWRAGTHVGDVVEVPVAAVSGTPALGPGAPPLDPNLHLAVRVTALKDGIVNAVPVGLAQNGVITTRAPANPGFAVSFPLSAIVRKVKV